MPEKRSPIVQIPKKPSSTVLVVDDFEPFRRFVCSALQSNAELQIIGQASDGSEAVQKASELQPDLILLDVGLPKLNGIEAGKRVRKVSPNTRILFLSQESSPDVIQEALRLGAMAYVIKTQAGRELLPAIEAVLTDKRFVGRGLDGYEGSSQHGHSHEILFCSDDITVVDGLARFIAAALNAGDAAIVWAIEAHRESIRSRLQGTGVDVDAVVQRGTYVASDVSEPPDSARIDQTIRCLSEAASKAGKEHPRVAVCGERAGRLWGEGKIDEAIRLEQLLNDLAKVHELNILCTYPGLHTEGDEQEFKSICAEHSAVYSR